MSLLGTGILKQAEDLIFQNFDTWKRQITIWKTPKKTVVSTNPTKYNPIYGNNNPTTQITFTPVSGNFDVDIVYTSSFFRQKADRTTPDGAFNAETNPSQLKLFQDKGDVRITLDETARNFLVSGSNDRIQFDGKSFKINTSERPHTIYERNLYDVWLIEEK